MHDPVKSFMHLGSPSFRMAQPNPAMQQRKDNRTAESDTWHRTAKVVELIGNSKTSFEDAVQSALEDAAKSVRHIAGADVVKFSVKCEEGRIIEYRADLKVAFGIEGAMRGDEGSRR